MRLINANSNEPSFTAVEPETLDALWYEAEQLGRIKCERGWSAGDGYEVDIMFYRKSGTRVHAVGKDTSVVVALGKAINEAREMGAGASD